MTGLRGRILDALREADERHDNGIAGGSEIADAVLGVLGDQDTLALIQRVLAEHAIHDSFTSPGEDEYLWCVCGWRSDEPLDTTPREARALASIHQAAAVVAALTEEQT